MIDQTVVPERRAHLRLVREHPCSPDDEQARLLADAAELRRCLLTPGLWRVLVQESAEARDPNRRALMREMLYMRDLILSEYPEDEAKALMGQGY